jgi:hypothetical protein
MRCNGVYVGHFAQALDSFRNVCSMPLTRPVVAILYCRNPVDACQIYYGLIDLPCVRVRDSMRYTVRHVIHDSDLHTVVSGPLWAAKSDASLLTKSEEVRHPLYCTSRVLVGKCPGSTGSVDEDSQRARAGGERRCPRLLCYDMFPFPGPALTEQKSTKRQHPEG